MRTAVSALLLLSLVGCTAERVPVADGPRVDVAVAALVLAGADDVCYDVRVRSGAGVVWQRGNPLVTRLGADQTAAPGAPSSGAGDTRAVCSSDFGDAGGGDLALVGPCDATSDSDSSKSGVQNEVTVWLDGVYAHGVDLADWRDPCPSGCSVSVDCAANRDARASFELVIMRTANQGFFDIAVSFDDIFCSAKLDTCYPDGDDVGTDPDPIRLVFGADDQRDWTAVFGLACSAGADVSATRLGYAPVQVTCSGGDVFVVDPAAGPGNASVLSSTNATHRLHFATYRDTEARDCGTGLGSCHVVYWNLALSVDDLAALGGSCTLTLAATASDAARPFVAGVPSAPGLSYPYLHVAAALTTAGAGTCRMDGLDDGGPLVTEYCGAVVGGACPATCTMFDGVSVGATGVACPRPPIECSAIDDHNGCTIDGCDLTSGTPTHVRAPIVDDGNACTADGCNPSNGSATHTPISGDSDCDPNTVGDTCVAGTCVPGGCDVTRRPYGGGDGSAADPFQVCAPAHLENVSGATAGSYFVQASDLDLDGRTYGGPVTATLAGSYDGAGHSIDNLFINTTTQYVGVFGTIVAGGAVKDLVIRDVDITAGDRVGALAGAVLVGGTVTRVRAEGGVVHGIEGSVGGLIGANAGVVVRAGATTDVIMDTGDGAGGLAGRNQCNNCNQVCTITQSYATGNVTSKANGGFDTGGLVGRHQGGLISQSFATGDVRSRGSNTAGIVGRLNGPISDCYFLGTVGHLAGASGYNIAGAVGQVNNVAGECNHGAATRIYSASTQVSGTSCTTPGGGCPACTSITGALAGQLGGGTAMSTAYFWKESENPGAVFANALSPQCWTPGGGITPTQCSASSGTCVAAVVGLGVVTQQSNFSGLDFSATGVWRMPLANPLARIAPGDTTPLLSPVLAWQCESQVTCAP